MTDNPKNNSPKDDSLKLGQDETSYKQLLSGKLSGLSRKHRVEKLVESVLLEARKQSFDPWALNELKLAFVGFKPHGPDTLAMYNFPSNMETKTLLLRHSVHLMTFLGQGDAYHLGLYGSYPLYGLDGYLAYLYGFMAQDGKDLDKRNQGEVYIVMIIYFPRSLRELFHIATPIIEQICLQNLETLKYYKNLTSRALERLNADLHYALEYYADLISIGTRAMNLLRLY